MKIVHIMPSAPYNEGWGYQDNLLPKYQRRLGHEVTILVSNYEHRDGMLTEVPEADYVSGDGFRVVRLRRKRYFHPVLTNYHCRLFVKSYLVEIRPDLIFYHGLGGSDIYDAIEYKRNINPACCIIQDNHIDENNLPKAGKGKDYLLRALARRRVRKTIAQVDKVYGVTPWRTLYAQQYYGVPAEKADVLIMGADDDMLDFSRREMIRGSIRDACRVEEDEFLIVTGGKIDSEKKIHLLMDAVSGVSGVKLLVFGRVNEDIRAEFDRLLAQNENIIYVGWIPSEKVYDYFFAADLVIFPGGHSVMWEQACASKVPCVFQRWDHMEHLNSGGNSDFLYPITVESLREKIRELRFSPRYYEMKNHAESAGTDVFRYSKIAEKSLECVK